MVAVEFVAVFAAVAVAEVVVVAVAVVVVVVVVVVVAAAAVVVVGERLAATSSVYEVVETGANKMLRYHHWEFRQRRS